MEPLTPTLDSPNAIQAQTHQRKEQYHRYQISMASEKRVLPFALLLLILGALRLSNAQTICNVSVAGLMACKPAVTPPKPAAPSGNCCSALSHADLRCLCSYKNSKLLPSLGIDPNLAMQLPGKCHLPHPANC
ncbi:hypothetical protein L6164_013506 [Bauhinia variegata]|uniref:Uncharacterized protein n=1 Tax=Bauhinia variegata TaxID=167791 RepID=A0ACB9NE96_BAUVA|nr:hypothetical protein L6164_013506 [Bauhinia variegata]